MAKENSIMVRECSLLDNEKIACLRDKEKLFEMMENNTREISKGVWNMAKVSTFMPINVDLKGCLNMTCVKEKATLHVPMEGSIKDSTEKAIVFRKEKE